MDFLRTDPSIDPLEAWLDASPRDELVRRFEALVEQHATQQKELEEGVRLLRKTEHQMARYQSAIEYIDQNSPEQSGEPGSSTQVSGELKPPAETSEQADTARTESPPESKSDLVMFLLSRFGPLLPREMKTHAVALGWVEDTREEGNRLGVTANRLASRRTLQKDGEGRYYIPGQLHHPDGNGGDDVE